MPFLSEFFDDASERRMLYRGALHGLYHLRPKPCTPEECDDGDRDAYLFAYTMGYLIKAVLLYHGLGSYLPVITPLL